MGKIENDKLVGGDAGESDDDDEEVKQIIELLKKGEITNIGPKPSTSQSTPSSTKPQVHAKPKSAFKLSKFKATMTSESSLARLTSPDSSSPNTPISFAGRSSPKLVAPQERQPKANPVMVPTATSRPSAIPESLPGPSRPSAHTNAYSRPSTSSTVIESSSKQNANSQAAAGLTSESFHPVYNPFSNIIDSPSFLPTGAIDSPEFQSMITDPSSLLQSNNKPSSSRPALSPKTQPMAQMVTERVVMSVEAKESKSINSATDKPEKKQRISRFMAERM